MGGNVDRALHLALFVFGGVAFAVAALAVIERLSGAGERAIRAVHVAIPIVIFVGIGIAERLYHALH